MSIINLKNKTFVYIDPSRQYIDNPADPDGLTPNTSLYNLPSNLQSDKIYLIRKTYRHYVARGSENLTNTDCTSLSIWGMPSPGEDRYDLIPDIAKQAWDEDNAINNHASLYFPGSSYHGITFTNLQTLDLYNFWFMESNSNEEDRFRIRINSDNVSCNINIERVVFTGVVERSVDNEIKYQMYNEYPSSFNRIGSRWIYANNNSKLAHSTIIKNCTFYSSGVNYGLNLGYCINTEISNCTINNIGTSNMGEGVIRIGGYNSESRYRCYVNCHDCDVNLYHSIYTQTSFGRVFRLRHAICDIKNISIKFADEQYGSVPSDYPQFDMQTGLIYADVYPGSRIQDITAEFGEWMDLVNKCVVHVNSIGDSQEMTEYRYGINRYGQYVILKDISIHTSSDDLVGGLHDSQPSLANSGYDYDYDYNYYGSYGPGSAAIIVRKTDNSSPWRSSDDILLQNLILNVYRGCALVAEGCMIDMASNTISGLVRLAGCVGKIGTIKTYAIQKALCDHGSNLIHINKIVCNRQHPTYEYIGQPAINIINWNSNILVTETNTKCFHTDNASKNYDCTYICTNNQIAGNYTCRNNVSFCQTWSIYRTGSESQCSLKCENNTQYYQELPLRIGGSPFKGITKHANTGNRTIKLYMTTYGYNKPEQIAEHVFVKVKRANGSIVTGLTGEWKEDTISQWNNIDGGTAFVLEMPLVVSDSLGEDLEFEYSFNWFYTDAAVYIDPYPVIE